MVAVGPSPVSHPPPAAAALGRARSGLNPEFSPKSSRLGISGSSLGRRVQPPPSSSPGNLPRAPRGAPHPKSWPGSQPGAGASLGGSGTPAGTAPERGQDGTRDRERGAGAAGPDPALALAGGGGGQALSLDASLLWGHTEHCETFDNPPLCQENFQVQLLEVWGFQRA